MRRTIDAELLRLDRAAGVLPERPADHEDPRPPSRSRGKAAAPRRAVRGRCAPGAPAAAGRRGRRAPSRRSASLRPPLRRPPARRGSPAPPQHLRRSHRRPASPSPPARRRWRRRPGRLASSAGLPGARAGHRRAGQHEPRAVEPELARPHPARLRVGADEEKEIADRLRLGLAAPPADPGHALEVPLRIAAEPGDLGLVTSAGRSASRRSARPDSATCFLLRSGPRIKRFTRLAKAER